MGGGVDVVLITYNQESYIAKAVESILMQRVKDDIQVRVLVADDSSTDKTLEIIKSYEEKSPFPFVYLPAEQNMGVAANYKRAFEATEADYVAVMEGDDWWCDTYRLQKHVDYLSIHPDCVMTKNNYMQYSQRNNVWSVEQANVNILTLKQSLKHYVLANMSCTMFRGELLRNMDERVYEYGHNQWREATDWYTHIYLLQKGYGYVLDEVMSVYRVDTGENISRTERTDNEMLDKAYLCYEQTMMLLGKDYKDECYEIYLATKRDVERDKICKRIIKWSNYMPPFMAIFFAKTFPNVLWHCKHIIRQCIPHKVYYKLKRKK